MVAMAEIGEVQQQGNQEQQEVLSVSSYRSYVDALVDQLELTAPLPSSGVTLASALENIQVKNDATPIEARFRVKGYHEVQLNSQTPVKEKLAEDERVETYLQHYALVQAKVQFVQKNIKLPWGEQNFRLKPLIRDIKSNVDFLHVHGYWKNGIDTGRRVFLRNTGAGLLAIAILAACGRLPSSPTSTESPSTNIPPASETLPPQATDVTSGGPESTPRADEVYPSSLTTEQLKGMLGKGGPLPEGFLDNPDVAAVMERIKSLYRLAGVNIDNPGSPGYLTAKVVATGEGDNFRWTVVLADARGNAEGWLMIKDANMASGWRFGETPVTDSRFNRAADTFTFGVPTPESPDNYFQVAYTDGFWILIEVDTNGNPVGWLDIAKQQMDRPSDYVALTETPVSVPEYYKGIAPDLDSFTLVTEEQEKLIMADIMAHPQLTNPTTHNIRVDADIREGGGASVGIGCFYGESCVTRASIRLRNPYGGLDLWKLIWEVRDPDGTHKYIIGYIGGGLNNEYIEFAAEEKVKDLQGIKTGQHINLVIATRSSVPKSDRHPYSWDIIAGAPEQDQEVLRELEKSKNSIPAGLSTITVQMVEMVLTP